MTRPLTLIAFLAFLCLWTAELKAQSVGINTQSPASSAVLDVSSTTKGMLVPRMNSTQRTGIASPANGLLVYDTTTQSFWYRQSSGWVELVSGVFKKDGGIVRSTGNHGTDDFVFGSENLPPPASTADTLFMFDKSKGAFRAGRAFNTKDWAPDSIGFCSFATGSNVLAKGLYTFASGRDSEATADYAVVMGYSAKARGVASAAFGFGTIASGAYSMASGSSTSATGFYSRAMGTGTTASGSGSLAMGGSTTALGTYATALGNNSVAESYASLAMGRYNIAGGNKTSWVATDPLFEIGIGTSSANKSNAVTVLKNGTVSFKSYSFPLNDGSANQHLSTNGSGQLQWQTDIGAFVRTGQLVKNSGNHYTEDFVFGSGSLPSTGLISDTLMFFDKSKGAFRTGALQNKNYWAPDSIGLFSFAAGLNAIASGNNSAAIGFGAKATKTYAIALGSGEATAQEAIAIGGFNTSAKGLQSIALQGGNAKSLGSISIGAGSNALGPGAICIGVNSIASGHYSVAMGNSTLAEAYNSVALGFGNVGGGSPSTWVETDPLFEIGNGFNGPSNALTILKNGDTHLVHGNSGIASGLKLENSSNGDWMRMYVSSGSSDLRLYSKSQGSTIIGAFDDVTGAYTALSDRNVKKDFHDLHFTWDNFMKLKPLTYQFIADKTNSSYIGMIAQEVKEIYPEMVRYQEDQDLYHMDYAGFGVIAVKAIQKLKEELIQKDQQLETIIQKNIELESRIARLEVLINN